MEAFYRYTIGPSKDDRMLAHFSTELEDLNEISHEITEALEDL